MISNGLDVPSNIGYCCFDAPGCPRWGPPAQFRQWTFNSTVNITGSTFIGNTVTCATCSGGAIAIQPGGNISITNSILANNSAVFFGGGAYIGGPSHGTPTCSLNVSGSLFDRNVNDRSGGQLYSSCGGSMDFTGASFHLMDSVAEVAFVCVPLVYFRWLSLTFS
jgi:hypothetical protein